MVTLVIPIFNMEDYLPRCLASIRAQTCRDFEVVLVDDGSTDSSGSLCDSYAAQEHDRIRVIHKPNGGLSSARNAGIDAAGGEFVIFPDPDDWLEPDYVEAFLHFQRQSQADMVCLGHYVDTDESSVPAGSDCEPTLLEGAWGQRSLLLGPRIQGFSWNKLYRLDIIRNFGIRFPEGMGTTEDLYFSYQYLAHCERVCHAPGKRVYHYYQRKNSTTRSGFSPNKLDTIRTYEAIIADCSDRDPELARAAADEICTCAVNLLWLYENWEEKDPGIRRRLLDCIRRNLFVYMGSTNYSTGRKLQALLAAVCPRGYMHLKNAAHQRNTK